MALPSFNAVGRLISLEIIVSIAYLGNWALVVCVIISRFLLEMIGPSSLGPLPFQAHLKLTQEFFPLRLQHVYLVLSNWPKEAQITFTKVFHTNHMTILKLTSFLI
jgi:hypothetical protein